VANGINAACWNGALIGSCWENRRCQLIKFPYSRFVQLAHNFHNPSIPKHASVLQAYADGVNQFISSHAGKYPIEFDMLSIEHRPWTIEHSLLCQRLMAWELNYAR